MVKKMEEKSKLSYIMLGFVCLVLVFSAVQAVQINDLKQDIQEGVISGNVVQVINQPVKRTAAPAMVGGC